MLQYTVSAPLYSRRKSKSTSSTISVSPINPSPFYPSPAQRSSLSFPSHRIPPQPLPTLSTRRITQAGQMLVQPEGQLRLRVVLVSHALRQPVQVGQLGSPGLLSSCSSVFLLCIYLSLREDLQLGSDVAVRSLPSVCHCKVLDAWKAAVFSLSKIARNDIIE